MRFLAAKTLAFLVHTRCQATATQSFYAGLAAAKRGDYATALKHFRPLAEQGGSVAQNILGLMHAKGYGVTKGLKEPVRWYRKAAKQEYPAAQFNLGNRCLWGQDVTKDLSAAARWYGKAAEQGIVAVTAQAAG